MAQVVGTAGDDTIQVIDPSAAIDTGAGDDYVWALPGQVITTGTGRDVVAVRGPFPDQATSILRITDFKAGDEGDLVNFIPLLNRTIPGYAGENPFGPLGYLKLTQDGADTLISWDSTGAAGGASFRTIIRLEGVTASSLTRMNLGFAPDGGGPPVYIGTPEVEWLRGNGSVSDVVLGLGGDDTLTVGGDAPDRLEGGAGADQLIGGGGDDTLLGGADDDWLDGWAGNDRLEGGTGNDTLTDSSGDNVMLGGDGEDSIAGKATRAEGGAGRDTISLSNIGAEIDAGAGDDVILAAVRQVITTGPGQDVVRLASSMETTTELGANGFPVSIAPTIRITDFTAGTGGDRLEFDDLLAGAHLAEGVNPFGPSGYLTLTQQGADTVVGWDANGTYRGAQFVPIVTLSGVSAASLTLSNLGFASDGSPTPGLGLVGTPGDDRLTGGTGQDTLSGLGGADVLRGGMWADVLSGGDGADDLDGGKGDDRLEGGTGDDLLSDEAGANVMLGGDGDDTFFGSAVRVEGGAGNDTISIGTGAFPNGGAGATIDAGAGDDTIHADFWQVVTTGAGRDTVTLRDAFFREVPVYAPNTFPTMSVPTIRITDFTAGDAGDRMDLTSLRVYASGADWQANLFGPGGYLKLLQDGADTVITWDRDGVAGSGAPLAMFRLTDVDAGALTTENLGFDPLYVPPPGEVLVGTAGKDVLTGTARADTLRGLAGDDSLSGGAGADLLEGGAGNDRIDGGGGVDTLDLSAAASGIAVNLSKTTAQGMGDGLGRDVVLNVENIIGGSFKDTLTGSSLANLLQGGGGADTLIGLDGADTLDGGAGNDRLDGGLGADQLSGGAGDDSYLVDNAGDLAREDSVAGVDDGGNDLVTASVSYTLGAYLERLTLSGTAGLHGTGNALANRIAGNTGDNVLSGLGGADTLIGGRGDDILLGGDGDDVFVAGTGADLTDGGAGFDTLDLSANGGRSWVYLDGTDEKGVARANAGGAAGDVLVSIEAVVGSATDQDLLYGDAGANRFVGGGGNDRLYGKAGSDRLEGGAGADILSGGAGADDLIGGSGADWFVFDAIPAANETDRLVDFEAGLDKLVISRSAFGLGAGVMPGLIVGANPRPVTSGPVLLYDDAGGGAGSLFFDVDGLGGMDAVRLARLSNTAAISSGDLLFVA